MTRGRLHQLFADVTVKKHGTQNQLIIAANVKQTVTVNYVKHRSLLSSSAACYSY